MLLGIGMQLLPNLAFEDKPQEFMCNERSPCKVLPMDSLFAILDCDPAGGFPFKTYFFVQKK